MKKKLIVPIVALSLGLTATPAMARSGDGMADIASWAGGGWTQLIALLLPAVQKAR